jgi:DNA-directed RNA polymerase specialized sigma24 family protein
VNTDRSEKLLTAMLLHQTKSSTKQEKVHLLNLAGFSNLEIADLLDMTTGAVATTLYERKKTTLKRKSRKQ